MSRKPWSLKLCAADCSARWNTSSGTVIVPGKRMCPVAGCTPPSGTYATTGATMALPSPRAIRSASARTRALCLPSAMCGPFCSVPPIGTITVVIPASIAARNSVHVKSSRNTLSGVLAADAEDTTATMHVTASHTAKRGASLARSALTGRRAPPGPASAEPHRAESGDPLLRRGVRGEEPREALPRQRIDDEQMSGGRRGRHRLHARGDLDFLEGLGEAVGPAGQARAARVGLKLTRARHGELHQHRRDRREDGEDDHDERVAAALLVVTSPAEQRAPLRHVREPGDGAGQRGGDRRDEHVTVGDVRELVREHALELVRIENPHD